MGGLVLNVEDIKINSPDFAKVEGRQKKDKEFTNKSDLLLQLLVPGR